MIKTLHTVNSKFYGVFYELDDGRKLYLAHKTPGQLLGKKAAWCLEESLLRKCESLGIDSVGVVVRDGSRKLYYLTKRADFHDPLLSFQHYGRSAVERGLPAKLFRINPATCAVTIGRRAAIGR